MFLSVDPQRDGVEQVGWTAGRRSISAPTGLQACWQRQWCCGFANPQRQLA